MIEPRFFQKPVALDLDRLLALTGAALAGRPPATVAITGLAAIERAGPSDIALYDGAENLAALAASRAGACLVAPAFAGHAPAGALALVTDEPRPAFARVAAVLFPRAARPESMFGPGAAPGAVVHGQARLEPGVTVDPGAVIGPGAEIGQGAVICASAVVGPGVRIGRNSVLGPGAVVEYALIGDRVVFQAGASVGQGGGAGRFPHSGRVVIQDDAEIGANAVVARGSIRDTIIGEGATVEALARVAADAVLGRFSVLRAQAAVEAGVTIPDFTVLPG